MPAVFPLGRKAFHPSSRLLPHAHVGCFERLSSERAVAWRCAGRLSLRQFPGLDLCERTLDRSTLSVWLNRLGLSICRDVFREIFSIVERHGLLKGEILGVDSTTIEVNAAMRSFVLKDRDETHRQHVAGLARDI